MQLLTRSVINFNMEYNSNPSDSITSSSRLKLMPIGDSRTAGNGSTVLGGYKIDLFNMLRSHLNYAPCFVGMNQVATCFLPNCATSGYSSAQILTAVQTQSPLFPTTDVYLIDSGTNDVIAGVPTATTTGNVLSTIDKIYTDNPNATIFVANLYDRSGKTAEVIAYNSALATAVAGHAKYSATPAVNKVMNYDQYSVLGPYSPTYWGDVTHLNPAGYAIAATGWYNQIINLF